MDETHAYMRMYLQHGMNLSNLSFEPQILLVSFTKLESNESIIMKLSIIPRVLILPIHARN